MSTAIVVEYLDVLSRPNLVRRFPLTGERDLNGVMRFIERATTIEPPDDVGICRDPADDKFLAAAIAGSARFIVSEDGDLLDLDSYDDIQIVSAERFLAVLDDVR